MLQIHCTHQICQCHSHKKAVQFSLVSTLSEKHIIMCFTLRSSPSIAFVIGVGCGCWSSQAWYLAFEERKKSVCYFFIHSETDWHLWFCCCGQTWVVSSFILSFGLHVGVDGHLWFGLDTNPARVGQRGAGVISSTPQSSVSGGMSGDCLLLKHVHGLQQGAFVNQYPALFSVGLNACIGGFHHAWCAAGR